MRDWLLEGHLAWSVLEVVAELDLGDFYADYRRDGRGGGSLATPRPVFRPMERTELGPDEIAAMYVSLG